MKKILESPLIEDLMEERHLLYLLKYVFWTEPSLGFLESLLNVKEIPEGGQIDSGLNQMIKAVKSNTDRLDEYAEDLAIEFARLFIGPKFPPAIPYSSFYLSESKTVMTNVTIEVRKRYLKAGMAVKQLYSIPDDHVGIELEFISHLTERVIELYEIGERIDASRFFEMRNSFLNDHMVLWIPAFADKVLEHSREDFYKGAALALKNLIYTAST